MSQPGGGGLEVSPPSAAVLLWASSFTSLCQIFLVQEMGKLLPVSQVEVWIKKRTEWQGPGSQQALPAPLSPPSSPPPPRPHTHTSIPPFSHEAMARGPAVFPYVGSCCWFLKDQRTVASKDCASVHVTRMRVINKRPPTLQGLRKSLGLPFGASDGGQEDAQGDK